MKQHIDMIVMLIVAFLLFTKPNVLVKFANSILGRFVIIGSMLFSLLHSTLSGVFIAILFVLLIEESKEGFFQEEAKSSYTPEQISDKADSLQQQFKAHLNIRKNNCTGKPGEAPTTFVDSQGHSLTEEEIAKKYPFHFTNGKTCNPCADALQPPGICPFSVSPVIEQLTNMEEIKSVSSRGVAVPGRGGNARKSSDDE